MSGPLLTRPRPSSAFVNAELADVALADETNTLSLPRITARFAQRG